MFFVSKEKLQHTVDDMVRDALASNRNMDIIPVRLANQILDNFVTREEYNKNMEKLTMLYISLYAKTQCEGKPFIKFIPSVSQLIVYIDDEHSYSSSINKNTFCNNKSNPPDTIDIKLINVSKIKEKQYLLTFFYAESINNTYGNNNCTEYSSSDCFLDISHDIIEIKRLNTEYINRNKFIGAENNTIILLNNTDNTNASII